MIGAEQTLEASEHSLRALRRRGIPTPESELTARRRNHLVGDQTQLGNATAQSAGGGQPTVELPPHPFAKRSGGQRTLMAPGA